MKNKYINTFDTEEEYLNYLPTASFPNIAYIKETDKVEYKEDEYIHFEDANVEAKWKTYLGKNKISYWDASIPTAYPTFDSSCEKFEECKYFIHLTSAVNNTWGNIVKRNNLNFLNITGLECHCYIDYLYYKNVIVLEGQPFRRFDSTYYVVHTGKHIQYLQNVYMNDVYSRAIIENTTPPTVTTTFSSGCIIYVPKESLLAYKSATNFSGIANTIYAIGGEEFMADEVIKAIVPNYQKYQITESDES